MNNVEDVTGHYAGCIKAERRGADVLVLWRAEGPRKRLDGKMGRYELSYKWLADERADLSRVLGSEVSLWAAREVNLERGLFAQFQLFP